MKGSRRSLEGHDEVKETEMEIMHINLMVRMIFDGRLDENFAQGENDSRFHSSAYTDM